MKEIIEWHKYPDEKPNNEGLYLLQTKFGFWVHVNWHAGRFGLFDGEHIIAWAEMPKGIK